MKIRVKPVLLIVILFLFVLSSCKKEDISVNENEYSWTNYITKDGLAENYVTSIAVDAQDNIWFGTIGGGVSKLHKIK